MPHSKLAPVILGTVLAASLTPTHASATDGQPADTAALATAQAGGESVEALQNTAADTAVEGAENETETNTSTGTVEDAPADSASANEGNKAETATDAGAAEDAATDATSGNAEGAVASKHAAVAAASATATENAPVAIVRGDARQTFDDLAGAVAAAQDGDVIELARDQVLDRQLVISGNLDLTLRAAAEVAITRGSSFPLSGGKPLGMILLNDGASLTLEGTGNGTLTLSGENKDSNEAVVTLRESSTFTMRNGSRIDEAHCSWAPWGAVYVNSGTFVLDGGEIRRSFAMRNAAVAVERGSAFEMRGGIIADSRATYSQSMVWTKGTVRMTGGIIANNSSNVSEGAVVQVLSGGSFVFEGGTIGDNKPRNTFGMRIDGGGSLSLGADANMEGVDRIELAQGARLNVTGAPTAHSVDDPLEVVLAGTWDHGTVVATTGSPQIAQDMLTRLSVTRGGAPEQVASVGIDPATPSSISLASEEMAQTFALLDNPFTSGLGLELQSELTGPNALERLRAKVEAHFGGVGTPERRARLRQIDDLERYAPYLEAHREKLADSVIELSELGNPGAEAQRTQQGYQFDNLDATGLYLKPGQRHELVVYVEAQDPSKLSVAWRQVGLTESNSYLTLNLGQQSGLANGPNRVAVDLSNNTYGTMLYLRNDSTDNPARVRIEAADAPDVAVGTVDGAGTAGSAGAADSAEGAGQAATAQASTNPALGTSLGEHPFYEHDPEHPERFWDFVQNIKAYAERVERGEAADMTLLQMGDGGHAQFALRATVLAKAYAGIDSAEAARAYITRSNEAIQKRFELFWTFDGYDAAETGHNAISLARVYTAFTKTVTYPSTLYAYMRYHHMPEGYVESFLSGENVYSWGMSHEYGHMLDNSFIAVGEETNNLYSLAGSRQGGIEQREATNKEFIPKEHYHGNAVEATKRRDEELARVAAEPGYVPDWTNNDNWGTYIWTHLVAWWNGLHFFDGWDYSDYDFENSPYTRQTADDVKRYGAYGASVRILRSDPDAVETIRRLASGASSDKAVKYNRIAVAFTMGTGYNFAEYLYELGERDLTDEVLAYCAKYPSMPHKVQYFSLDTDAAIINGAQTYAELEGVAREVAPEVAVEQGENGRVLVTATMKTEALKHATTAYELYRNSTLIGFSRDGSFDVAADAGADGGEAGAGAASTLTDDSADDAADGAFDPAEYTVVAYDVRLNPSRAANVDGPVADDTPENEDGSLPGSDEQPGDGENGGIGAPGGDTGTGDGGSGSENGDSGDGPDAPGTPGDGDEPEQPGNENEPEQPGGGNTGDSEEDAEGDADGDQSGADKPGAGDDLPGQDNGNGTGGDTAGDESTAPDAGAQPDGNAVDQTTGDGQATDVAARTLTATGDTSLLAGGIAVLGSAAAFIGTAIAQRLRKS
ncbi:hypothetical protein B5G20_02290 [Collinsella sp. An7]|uniref:M60 family metallopeptidase n=1 Tax=Collinsella sp. An7 TaxID=1965651 RepID=UPI000B3852DE|nr:M60 family metallopeptidase [Collinsella sp. An7]OUN47573.1 hypothetical protein B5G20_02290 [Collinsella sp. An7]